MDQIYKAAKQSGTVSTDSGVPFEHEYENHLGKKCDETWGHIYRNGIYEHGYHMKYILGL
jgi:hypothetical protein